MQNDYLRGFTLVIISGAIWSFSAPLVRLLEDAEAYRLHYLLYRSLIIISVVLIYIFKNLFSNKENLKKTLISIGVFFGLVLAFIISGIISLIKGVKGDWDSKIKPEDVVGPGKEE